MTMTVFFNSMRAAQRQGKWLRGAAAGAAPRVRHFPVSGARTAPNRASGDSAVSFCGGCSAFGGATSSYAAKKVAD